jgi:hypothetical protein
VFGQNMTKYNPAPSPSGHLLLSGPPTLNDIHQIFPRHLLFEAIRRLLVARAFPSCIVFPDEGMSLLGEVAPLIAPLLGEQALFRLTSSSKELRALHNMPLDLTGKCACASEALRVARVHHTRFHIPAFTVNRCSQADWEQLCALPGLVSLTVKGSRRNPTVSQMPPGPVSALSRGALLSLPQSRSIVSLRLLEYAGALVRDLSHATLCVALETLVLHGCAALTDVAPLAAAPRLRCLELRKATALTDLAPLCCGAACWRLARLGLQGCRLLRDVASLGALRALEEVRRTCMR